MNLMDSINVLAGGTIVLFGIAGVFLGLTMRAKKGNSVFKRLFICSAVAFILCFGGHIFKMNELDNMRNQFISNQLFASEEIVSITDEDEFVSFNANLYVVETTDGLADVEVGFEMNDDLSFDYEIQKEYQLKGKRQ